MKIVHSWLKDYLGDDLPSPEKVEELLTFHSFEVEGIEKVGEETVIEVKILPDRAGDCLSHRGVARELATVLGVSLNKDPLQDQAELPKTERVKLNISDTKACRRFTAVLITGVTIKESPEWLQKRLLAIGQRPINNIVDATNYVMYALGQPMHAYDADGFPQVAGGWQMGVRFARPGEQINLLAEKGKETDRLIELDEQSLVIVDGSSDTPVGLAGIKGGRFAELQPSTKNIILEAASFDPTTIRKTAVKTKILTDASKRFENAPSPELPLYAQRMITALILETAGGVCDGLVDSYSVPIIAEPVQVSVQKTNELLGLNLSESEIRAYLERTGSSVIGVGTGVFSATPPFERIDLTMEVNFIEEVGRIHGLSAVESVMPIVEPLKAVNIRQYYSEKIRQALVGVGYSEVVTTSFQKSGNIELQNALASDKSCLRETLGGNLRAVLDANYAHCDLLGMAEVKVFEIGTVFEKNALGVSEHLALALGVRTKGNGYCPKDDVALTKALELVELNLKSGLGWQKESGTAELNLDEVLNSLPVPLTYDVLPERPVVTYRPISPYPAMSRDIALWAPQVVTADSVLEILKSQGGKLLVRCDLFDTFAKEERVSYAFRLVFQANDRTLTDVEVNEIMGGVYKLVQEQGWEVR